MLGRARHSAIVVLLLTAAVAAACGASTTTVPETTTVSSLTTAATPAVTTGPPTPGSTTTATEASPSWFPSSQEGAVMVYLVRGEHLATTWRAGSTDDPARAVMEGLLAGPTPLEKEVGFSTSIPTGTSLRGVAIEGHTAKVDLSGGFDDGGGSLSMLLRVAQVVYTLTELPEVERVEFLLDGAPAEAIGGEGVVVAGGVTREEFRELLPPVLLLAPAPGEAIADSVTVRGNVANDVDGVKVVLTGRDGGILTEAEVELGAPENGRRDFSQRLSFTSEPAEGAIIVTWPGADGREESLELPLKIGK